MPSLNTIVLALAAVCNVSAAPFKLAARDVCGAAPSATGASKTPLETFTDAQTAEQCYADCVANPSCQSFLFGLVDNAIKCELFDVSAAQIPTQDSANLVAFDKACTSIPDVKPTAANPQGLATGATSNNDNNQDQNGNTGTTQQQQQQEQKQTKRSTCGAAPSGSGSAQPISTPGDVNSLDACIAACKQNPSCKSVEFGKLTTQGANVCRFFDVAAAQVPKATDGQSFQVSDVACA